MRYLVNLVRFVVLTVIVAGCVTPMGPSDIDALTTCPKGVDIAKVKKNLLLAGYTIPQSDADQLVTDFKQEGGRSWTRITALKMDDVIKFRVRVRSESVERNPTSSTSVSSGTGASQNSVNVQNYQVERVQNDHDRSYYVEYRPDYERTKIEVCGSL